ncbi:hypothetical protein [Saccharothrix sp. Mg75]|uniref:hypothetical protein n=1 Tax=Saccharothrix sp. Mg75 TaxID=3445357 RepID=UPI003EED0AE9
MIVSLLYKITLYLPRTPFMQVKGGIANARPLQPLPQPATHQAAVTRLDIRRLQRLGGILNEYHYAA